MDEALLAVLHARGGDTLEYPVRYRIVENGDKFTVRRAHVVARRARADELLEAERELKRTNVYSSSSVFWIGLEDV